MPTNPLPRWRGFNLLDMFTTQSDCQWKEDDFRWISDWGFDFVRLPLCYLLWVEDGDPYRVREDRLACLDQAVTWGQQYGVHVNLNFHRAPGYSVNPERQEPYNLWRDAEALEAFCFQWELMARRYRGIGSDQLSFNLVNEPTNPDPARMTREDHARVMRATVARIRAIDPERLILLDGLTWGNETCPELADLGVGQSCRAYAPMTVSHYRAPWVNGERFALPTWPGAEGWDRARLEAHYAPWGDLIAHGVGVHCGEGGAFRYTPHDVVLAWLRDVLEILTGYGIGLALWNFRGTFGILDSQREDAKYEEWHGHQLDRGLLELLREF